ncbi:MAG: hypothetical protein ABIA75_04760 [Candidatus Neomarinimicrobiota bacterium]
MHNKLTWLGAVIMLVAALGGQTQTVIGEGLATTREAALTAAKRDAVEKGIGVIIASETLVKNAMVAEDRILSKANGFVKTWEEISASETSDGLWEVKISAVVTDILDEVVKDQLALDLLLDWLRNPRFMVMIDELNVDDPKSAVAETEIGRVMGQKGFDIISPTQSEALRQRNVNLAEIQSDPNAVIALANEFGAEYIVTGTARANAITHAMLGSSFSGQGNITAQVIRADNAQILAQETFHGKAIHVDQHTAGMYSLKDAAEQLSNFLISESIRRWSLEQSNARPLDITLTGINFGQRKQFIEFLETSLNGIAGVDRPAFIAGVLTLRVRFTGTGEEFADAIYGCDFGSFTIEVHEVTANKVVLQAMNK